MLISLTDISFLSLLKLMTYDSTNIIDSFQNNFHKLLTFNKVNGIVKFLMLYMRFF